MPPPVVDAADAPGIAGPMVDGGPVELDELDVVSRRFFDAGEASSRPPPAEPDHASEPDRASEPDAGVDATWLAQKRERGRRFVRYVAACVGVCLVVCVVALVARRGAQHDEDASGARSLVPNAASGAGEASASASSSSAPGAVEGLDESAPAPGALSAASSVASGELREAPDPSATAAADASSSEPSSEPTADPAVARAAREQARRKLAAGDLVSAVAAASASIEADPTDAEAWLILGAAQVDQGLGAEARQTFQSCAARARRGPVAECRAMLR